VKINHFTKPFSQLVNRFAIKRDISLIPISRPTNTLDIIGNREIFTKRITVHYSLFNEKQRTVNNE